jgi:hypothetical protein
VRHKPRKLPTGLLSWMGPTLLYPEDEMLPVAGMDSVVMTRLLMYGELEGRGVNSWIVCVGYKGVLRGVGEGRLQQQPGKLSQQGSSSSGRPARASGVQVPPTDNR